MISREVWNVNVGGGVGSVSFVGEVVIHLRGVLVLEGLFCWCVFEVTGVMACWCAVNSDVLCGVDYHLSSGFDVALVCCVGWCCGRWCWWCVDVVGGVDDLGVDAGGAALFLLVSPLDLHGAEARTRGLK